MMIKECELPGVFLIKRQTFQDERGGFERLFCKRELEEQGIDADFVQSNLSTNHKKGTLRGLHSQRADFAEDKLVCCTRGTIFDVCVDVRKDSKTFGQYVGAILSDGNHSMLYIPKGFAHGYLTLEDETQVLYFVTQFYTPNSEIGYRYDDPVFHIDWPQTEDLIISKKDQSWNYLENPQDRKMDE